MSNVAALLETMQAEVVADRFNNGGLAAGGESHLVAPPGSRAQTRYRLGDIDITSPSGGEPLLFPELAPWNAIAATTAMTPIGLGVPGLAIDLELSRPASRWSGSAEGLLSRPALVAAGGAAGGAGSIPAVLRLQDWTHGTFVISGPVGARAGVLVGGSTSASSTRAARRPTRVEERARSLFAQHTYSGTAGRTMQTLGWLQSVRAPSPHATSADALDARAVGVHVQSTLASSAGPKQRWRLFAGYTQRRRDEDVSASTRVADRLLDGPIPDLVADGRTVERRWSAGGRATPWRATARQQLTIGASISATALNTDPAPGSTIAETIDGRPARVWVYAPSSRESRRHASTLAAFLADRIHVSPALTLDASLAYELVSGSAAGAAEGVTWHSFLPQATAIWQLGTRAHLTLTTGYRRAANALTLDLLAVGDPAAPSGSVYRWEAGTSPQTAAPLVARVGPGTGSDAGLSAIDAGLERPHAGEFAIALESRPSPRTRLAVTGIARRESSLLNIVNIGVPTAAYRTFSIPDANADLVGTGDDQLLPVYERLPESFGRDRYLLTNPPQDAATMGTLVISAQHTTPHLFLLAAATASASVGQAGHRGFRSSENDQAVIGELFTTPNAATNARGRLFSDRAYTIKWTTVYRAGKDVRIGAIARYEDGQPFSRLVIVPGLAQGTDVVRAFANGRSRFAFTGTLDLRLQKGFRIGARLAVDAIADVYNALNLRKEVEESVVTGDRFRTPAAVQPPRAVHLGFRVTF